MNSVNISELKSNPNYIDLSTFKGVRVNLIYTRADNFLGRNVYGDLTVAYLHKDAADKLRKAYEILQTHKPGWGFIVTDALRPVSVHKHMWDAVKGTPQEIYLADPKVGSVHNYGLAVDLSLTDASGAEVDMATPIDSFDELAHPDLEEKFLATGRLTQEQYQNRLLLRKCMIEAGFLTIPHEWWHFNSLKISEVKSRYPIVE